VSDDANGFRVRIAEAQEGWSVGIEDPAGVE
jgi:hypothetical protein